MEQVAIKPPNSSHSAGKLMHQNYINVQAKENYEKGIANIGMMSLFDRNHLKKNHKRLHISARMVLQQETLIIHVYIFSVTLSFSLFSAPVF